MTSTRVIPGLNLESDIGVLADSWELSLAARNRRPGTIRSYLLAANKLDEFLAERGMPRTVANITREHVESHIAWLITERSQTTAGIRYRSLKVFFKWLVEQGEIRSSPMVNMKPPAQDEQPRTVYSHDQVKKLLNTAKQDGSFLGKRDFAVMMLLGSTGMRRAELANLCTDFDVFEKTAERMGGAEDGPSGFIDWEQNTVELHRTKGRRVRLLHIHPDVRKALLRWMQARATHRRNALPWLWLSVSGKVTRTEAGRLTTFGIGQLLERRCEAAGVPYLPAHSWRHMWVIRSREMGMSDASLSVNAGWSEKSAGQMLATYSRAEASKLARAEEAAKGYGATLG